MEEFLGKDCDCELGPCCDPSIQSLCNIPEILQAHLGIVSKRIKQYPAIELDKKSLCESLSADVPVVALFVKVYERHYAVLSGLGAVGGQEMLEVADPWDGRRILIAFPCEPGMMHPDGWELEKIFFLQGGGQ